MSKTDNLAMIHYLRNLNISLIDQLLLATVRTLNYTIENDQSDRIDYMERKTSRINRTIYRISGQQVKARDKPVIVYSNYRKLFNRTLAKFYKEQVRRSTLSVTRARRSSFRFNVVSMRMKFARHSVTVTYAIR